MLDSIDGWYSLADVGNQIRNLNPGFSPRWYGHEKLLSLVQSMPIIEIKQTDHIPPNYFIRTLEQTNNDVSIVVMPSSDESESPPSVQYFNTSGPGQRFPASPQSTAMVIHSVVSNAGLCSSPSELKQSGTRYRNRVFSSQCNHPVHHGGQRKEFEGSAWSLSR